MTIQASGGQTADFCEVLERRTLATPDFTVLQWMERGEEVSASITYEQLMVRSRAFGAAIQAATRLDDRILLTYAPGLDLVVAFCGVILAGRIPTIAATHLHKDPDRLCAILANAEPSLVVSGDGLHAAVREALTAATARLGGDGFRCLMHSQLIAESSDTLFQPCGPRRDSTAFLQYTSGSTSGPKGLMVSHANLVDNLALIRDKFAIRAGDVSIIWLPPYHDMGLIGGLLEPLFAGITAVLMPPAYFIQKPLRWLKAMHRFRGTITGAPNFALQHCVDRIAPEECSQLDLSAMRVFFLGAERIRAATVDAFVDFTRPARLPVGSLYPCYGLAESTLMVTGGQAGAGVRRHTHPLLGGPFVGCGTVGADQRLRIADPATGAPVPDGEVGEILIDGPSVVASGYYRNEAERARLYRADPDAAHDDGAGAGLFLRTGDMGYQLNGELYVTGRLREVLILRGRTLWPQELEDSIERALAGIVCPGGVACFSIENDSTEALVAVIEIRRSQRRRFDPVAAARSTQAALVAAEGVMPSDVLFVDEHALPRTSSGKLRRLHLRDRYAAGDMPRLLGNADGRIEQAADSREPAEP